MPRSRRGRCEGIDLRSSCYTAAPSWHRLNRDFCGCEVCGFWGTVCFRTNNGNARRGPQNNFQRCAMFAKICYEAI